MHNTVDFIIAAVAFGVFNFAIVIVLAFALFHAKRLIVGAPTVPAAGIPAMPAAPLKHRIAEWMDAHAAPEWRLAARLRSVQISVFWAVIGGLWVALPAFQSFVKPVEFGLLCVGFSLAILFARLTGQKGLPDV